MSREKLAYKIGVPHVNEHCAGCGRRYSTDEHAQRECPKCGQARFCHARMKNCRDPDCCHRYTKEEYELLECPECGEPRLCRKKPNRGMKVCRVHGGGSPGKGRLPGKPTKGKPRKYFLPTGLDERLEAALADRQLLDLREDIAVTQAYLADKLSRIGHDPPAAVWKRLVNAVTRFEAAQSSNDADGMRDSLAIILTTVRQGFSADAAWADVRAAQAHKQKLTDSEVLRLYRLRALLAVEEGIALVEHITGAVLEAMELYVNPDRREQFGAYIYKALLAVRATLQPLQVPSSLRGEETVLTAHHREWAEENIGR